MMNNAVGRCCPSRSWLLDQHFVQPVALGAGGPWYRSWRVGVILVMMTGTAIILFIIQPQMAALKVQAAGGNLGPQFGRLHGISSVIYLFVSVLGLLLVGGWRRGE